MNATHSTPPGSASPDLLSRLRIAVVTETFPPEVNGVALTMARVVEGLRARGHTVQVIRPRQPSDAAVDAATDTADLLMAGVPIPLYSGLRMGLPARRQLKALWGAQPPDLVHVATEGPLGYSAVQAARELGLPTSSDFRTNFDAYTTHYRLGCLEGVVRHYLRRFHNATDVTMVPTQALRQELQAHRFERVRVVSRGVDAQRFNPARRDPALRESWGAAAEDPVLMCVGRLAPEKNLALLGRTFDAVRQHHPRAKLVVVGDGPQRASLQAQWPEAHFAGARTGTDLAAHYASADLFVFPSMTETFGNVVVEALASGLACVAFQHAAAGQLFPRHQCGVAVPMADEAAFVAAALDLVADADHRQRLARQARQVAEQLDWPAVVTRFEEVVSVALLGEPVPHERSLPQVQPV